MSTYHYYYIIYADYDLSNSSRSKSCLEIKLIISVKVNEAKLFFDLTGFEPRTLDLQPSILTTRPQRPFSKQCYITNMR